LPALPDAWAASGVVTGLRAYGGFEVSFDGQDGQVQSVELRSTLGGNFRLRTPNALVASDGTPLAAAAGENPNPFFQTFQVEVPLISSSANLDEVVLEPTVLVDLPTEAGRSTGSWRKIEAGPERVARGGAKCCPPDAESYGPPGRELPSLLEARRVST
jgi:alpha-L-fucosidase 2